MKKRAFLLLSLVMALLIVFSSISFAASSTTQAKALSGKVVFWSMWNSSEQQAKVINSAISDFKAKNKNVKIDVKFNGRDVRKLLKPALDSGQQIDIFEQDPSIAMKNLTKYVLKLDSFIAQPAIGMPGKTVKDSINPTIMNWVKSLATTVGLEDGYYAIPQQPFAVLFFYNHSVFNKAGIATAPKTWEEFVAACDKLKKSGVEPITFDPDAYQDLFIGGYLASAMGSEWVSKLVNDKTGEMWKNPIVLQFAKDMQELRDKGYFSKKIAANKYPAGQQDLALDKSAMYLNGTWLPSEVSSTTGPNYKWGCFQYPTIKNGNGKGGQQELTFGANALLLNKNTKVADAAFEVVKYIVSSKAQGAMSDKAMQIPATINTKWPDNLKDAAVAFSNAKVNQQWGAGIDDAGDFSTASVLPVFMDLVSGKIDADAYVTKMVSEAKKFYAGK